MENIKKSKVFSDRNSGQGKIKKSKSIFRLEFQTKKNLKNKVFSDWNSRRRKT